MHTCRWILNLVLFFNAFPQRSRDSSLCDHIYALEFSLVNSHDDDTCVTCVDVERQFRNTQ